MTAGTLTSPAVPVPWRAGGWPLGLAILVICLVSPADARADRSGPSRTRSPSEPLITSAYRGLSVEQAMTWLRRLGANHVWLSHDATPEDAAQFASAGFAPVLLTHPSMRTGPPRSSDEFVYFYLKTSWHRKDDEPLRIELLRDFTPGQFSLARHAPPALAVKIQERKTRQALPGAAYETVRDDGVVTVTGGERDRWYRAVFLATGRPRGPWTPIPTDGTVASVGRRHVDQVRQLLNRFDGVSVVRPTSLLFDFMRILEPCGLWRGGPAVRYYSWWGYWAGTSPERLARHAERYGELLDPLWLADTNFGDEGFLPSPAYRRWIELVREDVHAYARMYNEAVHSRGRRIRLFLGDDWKGIEPWLGDLDSLAYDEVVTSLNRGPGAVRSITGFPGTVRRIVRFPWLGASPDDGRAPMNSKERIEEAWRWIKRELLFESTGGLTFGGDVGSLAGTPAGDELARIAADFRRVFGSTSGRRVYTHPITVYVVNAWGRMRSWITPTHYMSQRIFAEMVDWPVNLRWISFDEVVERGVPRDASVILLTGEPNTAWGGGAYWIQPRLPDAIRAFVRAGGGLIQIGGATYSDGRYALGDVLGVRYAGSSNSAAAEELWNVSRWSDSGRSACAYPHGGPLPRTRLVLREGQVPSELRARLQPERFEVTYDSKVRAAGAIALARDPTGQTGVFVHRFGHGRAVYIGGYGRYGRWLKALTFYAAGATGALDQLDGGHVDVATYWYPESRLLIVFNHGATRVRTSVRFDPRLAGVDEMAETVLEPLEGSTRPVRAQAHALKRGFTVSLDAGETIYWKVSPASEAEGSPSRLTGAPTR